MEIGKLTATTLGKTVRFEVRPGSPLSVGRSSRCSVKVRDPKMSRRHCQLEFVDGKVRVTDLESSHGLTYRGLKTASFDIEVGDGFHVGQTFIRFEARGVADDSVPAVEVRRAAPAPIAAAAHQDDDDEDDDEFGEYERAGDEQDEPAAQPDPLHSAPAAEYPEVPVAGRPTGRRRPARKRGSFAMQLFGQLCLVVTVVITTIAVVLAAKNHNPEWDVYRLLELLKPPK